MYEHHSEPVVARTRFVFRLIGHGLISVGTLLVSLFVGVAGYRITEEMIWLDALLNASMILGGMGPVNTIVTVSGKLFASIYSLFSGMVFLVAAGVMVAPIAHRLLHHLHRDEIDDDQG